MVHNFMEKIRKDVPSLNEPLKKVWRLINEVQYGVKTCANNEKSAPYWLLKRLAFFKTENERKPDQDEVVDITLGLELAINMVHNFMEKIRKDVPSLNEPLKKVWRLINEVLSKTKNDDELKQNTGTTVLNHAFIKCINDLKKNPMQQ